MVSGSETGVSQEQILLQGAEEEDPGGAEAGAPQALATDLPRPRPVDSAIVDPRGEEIEAAISGCGGGGGGVDDMRRLGEPSVCSFASASESTSGETPPGELGFRTADATRLRDAGVSGRAVRIATEGVRSLGDEGSPPACSFASASESTSGETPPGELGFRTADATRLRDAGVSGRAVRIATEGVRSFSDGISSLGEPASSARSVTLLYVSGPGMDDDRLLLGDGESLSAVASAIGGDTAVVDTGGGGGASGPLGEDNELFGGSGMPMMRDPERLLSRYFGTARDVVRVRRRASGGLGSFAGVEYVLARCRSCGELDSGEETAGAEEGGVGAAGEVQLAKVMVGVRKPGEQEVQLAAVVEELEGSSRP
ncbi:hypothetical protein CYMTET_19252 [Cymbomonas tetramitiformis]|uniref:Uncharacterized protein n=1 Tax=Cymbomonas tetramitiformis TaxID=36881 RepID=A0AAE0G6Z3_9CHLO|nr:hypothetical protein CYMTET_19252 [Cymbomonas tetramitiformis]